jgi:hypothetical protein
MIICDFEMKVWAEASGMCLPRIPQSPQSQQKHPGMGVGPQAKTAAQFFWGVR